MVVEVGVLKRLELRCKYGTNLGEPVSSLSQCTEAWTHSAEVRGLSAPPPPQLALSDPPVPP